MNVTLLFPDVKTGGEIERLVMFAARRARTLKSHAELMEEIRSASKERVSHFLNAILRVEWSLDTAEYAPLIYDIEGIPSWLATEFFRHRLILRDWSPEQRSKRAVSGELIPVINPFDKDLECEMVAYQMTQDLILHSQQTMQKLHAMGVLPQKLRYAALEGTCTALTLAGNARAMQHLYTMRGSLATGGDGKAAPEAQELADEMLRFARSVYPNLFKEE